VSTSRVKRTADVELRGLHKQYNGVVAVESLDLRVEPGEFVSLLGPSGCGKTTTLRAIAGLVRPDAGEIIIGGRVMNDVPVYRRGLGLVAQNYALFPHMTVLENVTFGLRMRGVEADEMRRRAREKLAQARLEKMESRYPRELSGGQQQRVALARCLVVEPDVLLLDEPLGALDKKLREAMQVELKLLQRQVGITTIFVTHDQEEALTMSDRIAVMHQGQLQQMGTPQEIYESPRNRFVADFIGICNFIECQVARQASDSIEVTLENGAPAIASVPAGIALPPIGTRIVATVRPERIELAPAHPDVRGVVAGEILEVVYVGTAVHYYVRSSAGTRLIAYRQNNSQPAANLQPGAKVCVSWDPGALRMLPQ
jgi:spermidine/putrescine ABC transporter ATP-binding subunit